VGSSYLATPHNQVRAREWDTTIACLREFRHVEMGWPQMTCREPCLETPGLGESHSRISESLGLWYSPELTGTSVPTADTGPPFVQCLFLWIVWVLSPWIYWLSVDEGVCRRRLMEGCVSVSMGLVFPHAAFLLLNYLKKCSWLGHKLSGSSSNISFMLGLDSHSPLHLTPICFCLGSQVLPHVRSHSLV
jgi:hypothetical protein